MGTAQCMLAATLAVLLLAATAEASTGHRPPPPPPMRQRASAARASAAAPSAAAAAVAAVAAKAAPGPNLDVECAMRSVAYDMSQRHPAAKRHANMIHTSLQMQKCPGAAAAAPGEDSTSLRSLAPATLHSLLLQLQTKKVLSARCCCLTLVVCLPQSQRASRRPAPTGATGASAKTPHSRRTARPSGCEHKKTPDALPLMYKYQVLLETNLGLWLERSRDCVANCIQVDCTAGDDTHPGTKEAPFASVSKAQTASRTAGAGTQVFLRAGTCYLKGTLLLTAADSGIAWSSWDGEAVTLSAGAPLSGLKWSTYKGEIMVAELPADVNASAIDSLFSVAAEGGPGADGSQRHVRARYPNGNSELDRMPVRKTISLSSFLQRFPL